MCIRSFGLKDVGDVAMCVNDALLLLRREVGGASWAVRFKVSMGEYFVRVKGNSIWACVVIGSGCEKQRVAWGWRHLLGVDIKCCLDLVRWGGGSWA